LHGIKTRFSTLYFFACGNKSSFDRRINTKIFYAGMAGPMRSPRRRRPTKSHARLLSVPSESWGETNRMMQIAAFLVFLVMGVTNLLAVQAGLTAVLGVPVLLALVVAVPVFYFRFVGSAAGIVGAIVGWQMPVPAAVLLFCWPVLVYGFLRGGAEARALLGRRAA
jgi:hypothetical protein